MSRANDVGVNAGTTRTTLHVAMWHNVRNIFDANGATNVIWCWIVQNYAPFRPLLPGLWPGNTNVDWVGWDSYQDSSNTDYVSQQMTSYNYMLTNSTSSHNYASKPWAWGEWGVGINGYVPTAAQESNTFNAVNAALNGGLFPRIRYIAYFDDDSAPNAGSAIQSAAWGAYSNLANSPFLTPQCTPWRTNELQTAKIQIFCAFALAIIRCEPVRTPISAQTNLPCRRISHLRGQYALAHREHLVAWGTIREGRQGERRVGKIAETSRDIRRARSMRRKPQKAETGLAEISRAASRRILRSPKSNGYDFYCVTDHSQEAKFQPPSPTNSLWVAAKRDAQQATDDNFVAILGYEHSENNGPGGVGHINVFNSAEYLNALAPGIDLPYLYRWLKTAQPNGEGPVVASFNHPGPRQYNNWDYRDAEITGHHHDARSH